jgi:hypothetical protein
MVDTGCISVPAEFANNCCGLRSLSVASATVTLLKLPVTGPVLWRNTKSFPGDGTNPLSLLINMDPDREVVPVTFSVSYPVPGAMPPSSSAKTLSGPRVRFPSMLRTPGEKPGASVPPFITTLATTLPVPARVPPLKNAAAPGGNIRLATLPGLPIRVIPKVWV